MLEKAISNEGNGKPKKSVVEKYAGTLSGKLSDENVKRIKDEYLMKKYSY